MAAQDVFNTWRALSDTVGVYTFLQAQGKPTRRVKIHAMKRVCEEDLDDPLLREEAIALHARFGYGEAMPRGGTMHYDRRTHELSVRCADGWIGVTELQVEGRKAVSARDFYNGLRDAEPQFTETDI